MGLTKFHVVGFSTERSTPWTSVDKMVQNKSSEYQHSAVGPSPPPGSRILSIPPHHPHPESLTPKSWGWGSVRVGLPSSIPPIVPLEVLSGLYVLSPLMRSLPSLSARGTSGPRETPAACHPPTPAVYCLLRKPEPRDLAQGTPRQGGPGGVH